MRVWHLALLGELVEVPHNPCCGDPPSFSAMIDFGPVFGGLTVMPVRELGLPPNSDHRESMCLRQSCSIFTSGKGRIVPFFDV